MKKQKSFTLEEIKLCTLVEIKDTKYGWIGSVASEKLAPYIGKNLKIKISVEVIK